MGFRTFDLPSLRQEGCTCPPIDRSGWNHDYGTHPTIEVDAWCPLDGLEAIIRREQQEAA